ANVRTFALYVSGQRAMADATRSRPSIGCQRRVGRARDGDDMAFRRCFDAGSGHVEASMSFARGAVVACNTRSRVVASRRADNGFLRTSLAPASMARRTTAVPR